MVSPARGDTRELRGGAVPGPARLPRGLQSHPARPAAAPEKEPCLLAELWKAEERRRGVPGDSDLQYTTTLLHSLYHRTSIGKVLWFVKREQ